MSDLQAVLWYFMGKIAGKVQEHNAKSQATSSNQLPITDPGPKTDVAAIA